MNSSASDSAAYASDLLRGLHDATRFSGMLPSLMNVSGLIKAIQGRDTVTLNTGSSAVGGVGVIDGRTLAAGQLEGRFFHRNAAGAVVEVSNFTLDRPATNYESARLISGSVKILNTSSELNAAGSITAAVLDFLPKNVTSLNSSDLAAFVANSNDIATSYGNDPVCGKFIDSKLGGFRFHSQTNTINPGLKEQYVKSAIAIGNEFVDFTADAATATTVFDSSLIPATATGLERDPFRLLTTTIEVSGYVTITPTAGTNVYFIIYVLDAAGSVIATDTSNVINLIGSQTDSVPLVGKFNNLPKPAASVRVVVVPGVTSIIYSAKVAIDATSESMNSTSEDYPVVVFIAEGMNSGAGINVVLNGLMDVKPTDDARQNMRIPQLNLDREYVARMLGSMIRDPMYATSYVNDSAMNSTLGELMPNVRGLIQAGYHDEPRAMIAARGFGNWFKSAVHTIADNAHKHKGIAREVLKIGKVVAPQYGAEIESAEIGMNVAERLNII